MNTKPKTSIVILTKNGGEIFKKSITMIFSQEVSFKYEVIIVDSGSTDDTLIFLKEYPVRIIKIRPECFCFGLTRDLGFACATGNYVVTISQDVIPADKDWLQNLINPFLNNEADVVQGATTIPKNKDVFYWIKIGSFYFTSERLRFAKNNGNISLSCTNLAIKKEIWDKTRFGDMPMNEDQAMLRQIYSKGYRVIQKSDALVYHGHTYDLPSLIKRCENEGFGWRCLGEKYSLIQLIKDLTTKKWIYGEFISGVAKGRIKNMAELLFIFVRPLFLYKGNTFNKQYKF